MKVKCIRTGKSCIGEYRVGGVYDCVVDEGGDEIIYCDNKSIGWYFVTMRNGNERSVEATHEIAAFVTVDEEEVSA